MRLQIYVWILIAVAAWSILGNPEKDVANWLWPDSAAPWEEGDLAYWPRRNAKEQKLEARGLDSVEACRETAHQLAKKHGDPDIRRGDYVCQIGFLKRWAANRLYRHNMR